MGAASDGLDDDDRGPAPGSKRPQASDSLVAPADAVPLPAHKRRTPSPSPAPQVARGGTTSGVVAVGVSGPCLFPLT